jgi:hypothetical protein
MSAAKRWVGGRGLHRAGAVMMGVVLLGAFCVPAPLPAVVAPPFVHGMWVWNSASILETPGGAEALRDFCKSEDINEVYLATPEPLPGGQETELSRLIGLLHQANIRVEALLSSVDADEPGPHRDALVRRAQNVVQFNQEHAATPFEGIHLDIEPQQRPENKGAGNLEFLPGLVDAWRSVRAVAESAGITVNADISNKLLKGDPDQRHMLLSAVPRVTLMMYELSSPADGESAEQKAAKVRDASRRYLDLAFAGLDDPNLARMAIALRTPDYGGLLPAMLKQLDDANRANPHYLGWARHSYNDVLKAAQ